MDFGIKKKVALVTGSGRGIGKETAVALAKEGAFVCVNDIDEDKGMEVCKKLKELGIKAIFAKGDVACEEDVKYIFTHVRECLGPVDILVNNAGVSSKIPFEDISAEAFEKIFKVNLLGSFLCAKEAFKDMKQSGWGRIINLSSMAGRFGANKASVDYAATKGGIIAMTLTLAKKMGPYNVTVNCVAPGRIDTDLTRALPQEVIDGIVEQIPMKRLGSPQEVANVVAFLASENAAYVSGACVDILGGYIA